METFTDILAITLLLLISLQLVVTIAVAVIAVRLYRNVKRVKATALYGIDLVRSSMRPSRPSLRSVLTNLFK